MSTERGPILRKRGNQPREPDATDKPAAPPPSDPAAARAPDARDARTARADQPPPSERAAAAKERPARQFDRGPTGRSAGPAPAEARRPPGSGLPTSAPPAAPVAGGRRLYDPRSDRSGGPAPGGSAARDPRGAAGAAGKKPFGTRPGPRDEKTELKTQAQKLAKDKGVPLVHAYRILKGQASLNDVLKGMMRKERFDQLVNREGIDRELAGQVASGHLPKQRAVLLTRMRTLRKQKLHIDGIKAAEVEKKRVALDLFGRGWTTGRVRTARPYDFDLLIDGAEKVEKFFKHDVKAICQLEDLDAALKASSKDERIAVQGLAATEDREQRIRPEDDIMLRFIDDQRIVRFTMRDGEQLLGRLRSFGRWDAELVLDGGEIVTVFFHGLHKTSATLGHQS